MLIYRRGGVEGTKQDRVDRKRLTNGELDVAFKRDRVEDRDKGGSRREHRVSFGMSLS